MEDGEDGASLLALEDAVMGGSQADLDQDEGEEGEADDLMGRVVISGLRIGSDWEAGIWVGGMLVERLSPYPIVLATKVDSNGRSHVDEDYAKHLINPMPAHLLEYPQPDCPQWKQEDKDCNHKKPVSVAGIFMVILLVSDFIGSIV